MNFNPTPKTEFMKDSANLTQHRELATNDRLHRSLQVALLEMSRRICSGAPAENMGACAAAHLRMLGAQDFVEIFLNLAETPVANVRPMPSNLPGNVPTRKEN